MFGRRTSLTSFLPGQNCFGVILKGKSLEKLEAVSDRFDSGFIVNNFDSEYLLLKDLLRAKRLVHFVNRLMTAPMRPEHYRELGIREVQLCKASAWWDKRLQEAIRHYRGLGLDVVYLPKQLLSDSKRTFGRSFTRKFPNTGLLAIKYALDVLKPKELIVVGLDFYQADYLVRRPHQAPIEQQRRKMQTIKAEDVLMKFVSENPETQFTIVTYYGGLKCSANLKVL